MRAAAVCRALLLLACAPVSEAVPGVHTSGPPESTVPLIQALVEERVSDAFALIDGGADVDAKDVIMPLYAAQEYVRSSRSRHQLLRRMLREGAQVDQPTLDGSTTLMLAAYHGDVRSSTLLLEYGADPLRANNAGYNALSAATEGNHFELAEMLREHIGESGLRHSAAAHTEL
ncbi:hypothetical protein AB1Y20_017350 [Prymnesium parvum]|uniref:Ankyrin repeat domain-containing protein n=1 Tax=Prymnesium parvum TaxID=97485 RepID=A0AB34JN72_PRYPA